VLHLPVLAVNNLSVRYDSALILEDISLFVEEKECVAVLGPNGAGKTTLLKAISRVAPVSGSISYLDEEISRYPAHELVKKGIVHCPEHRRLFPDFTVRENSRNGRIFTYRIKTEIEGDLERSLQHLSRLNGKAEPDGSRL